MAKAQGRDVGDWEKHLEKLKHQASEFAETTATYSLSELLVLRRKDESTLHEVRQVKIVFGGGRVVQ